MEKMLNVQLTGRNRKPILLDVYYHSNGEAKPVAVFAHGFKGFKNWGCWDKVAARFADEGFVFVKFNFSYNGTTPEQPGELADLEAFGNNNFSIELDDLDDVIGWLYANNELQREMDLSKLSIIGHSRGGGVCVIKATEDKRISKLVTWAGVSRFDRVFSADMEEWKQRGVVYTINGRTGQRLPLYYQLYRDFITNSDRLDVLKACRGVTIPSLIVHGTDDEAVPQSHAQELNKNIAGSMLHIVEEGTHTFGMKHPCGGELPAQMREVADVTIDFLKNK